MLIIVCVLEEGEKYEGRKKEKRRRGACVAPLLVVDMHLHPPTD